MPAKEQADNDTDLSFEEALSRLEASVEQLEEGDLALEEALKVFENGIAASRACTRLLDQTRKRVQVLVEQDGDLELAFLDAEDDADQD